MLFSNRRDAAQKLIPLLEKYRNDDSVVVAVPRGGVVVGYHIAKHFHFPLEIVLTKKIGHPFNKEYAIGAVSLESEFTDAPGNVPESYIASEIQQIRHALKERYKTFMGGKKPIDLKGKTIILVDDGIATGSTLIAAIRLLRLQNPGKIVIAAPVSPPDTLKRLKEQVEDLICLHSPFDFVGVGQFYVDFAEVTDEEVIPLLQKLHP